MRKKAGIILFTILIVIALVAVWFMNSRRTMVEYKATGYDDLKLLLENHAYKEEISLWESEDGTYYCFLPAGWEEGKLTFHNIGRQDWVMIGDQVYENGNSLNDRIVDRATYSMQMQVDGTTHNAKKVVFMKSANLPTLFIHTDSGNLEGLHADKEYREGASMTLIDGQGQLLCSEKLEYMKARGNSTFYEVDKKAYQLKMKRDVSILGMPEARKWLLMANAIDNTLLRNQIVFDYVSQYTKLPSIKGEYVDVYLNGEFAGNYFLCEKVETGPNRLNIVDLEAKNQTVNDTTKLDTWEQYVSEDGTIRAVKGMKNPEDITGGYLLELAGKTEYESLRSGFVTDTGNYYRVVSPVNASVEQVEYICDLFNKMETAIMQEDGIHPDTGKHFTEYLDLDSWTSKHLIEEGFHNPDGPYGSCYFYKDADYVSPLIKAGPVWDYDRAMGGYERVTELDDPKQIRNLSKYSDILMEHDVFKDMVSEKFKKDMLPYMEEQFNAYVNQRARYLETSAEMDSIRWPHNSGYYVQREAHLEYLKQFMHTKTEFLKENWLEGEIYHRVIFLDYGGNICGQYAVKHGDTLNQVPITRNYAAIFKGWYSEETGERYSAQFPVLEDITYVSEWLDVGMFLQNGYAAAEIDAEQVDLDTMKQLLEEIEKARVPQNIGE